MIRFGAPWILAITLPIAIVLIARLRRLPREHAGIQRRAIQLVIVLGALAAAIAPARPELGRSIDRMAVIYLLDRSRSTEEAAPRALAQIRASADAMDDGDAAGLVAFGAEAATLVAPSSHPTFGLVEASLPRDATDIASAIRRGLADLPAEHAPRLVLVSDGAETEGDALSAASAAAARGVPIDVLVIERSPRAEVAIERVRMPASADPGQPVELRVVTRATRQARVRVRISRDGTPIASTETSVRAGADVLTLRDVAPSSGVHRYEVLLEPIEASADRTPENNEGGALLRVTGGSRALVLSERPAEASALADALRSAGLTVELGDATRLPADLAELATWDLVVLSDFGAHAFTDAQMNEMAAYVRDLGGGLLMTGARDAFGLGGYAFTPIEEVLPASFDLRRQRNRASLAMVIAIDQSGSMSAEAAPGVTKLDLANEAAARSAMLLSPLDRVAVAHVDTEVHWSQPMTVVEDPRRIAAAVRRAQPGGGGILVDLTLRASYGVLRETEAQLKHLLLFSDGSDSEEMVQARTLVARAARDRITTSIVSMGSGPDTPELEQLSRIGGGRFYIVEDLTQLPRIFTEETIAASRSALVNQPFRARPVEPGAATRGIDLRAAPMLGGYAVVNPRPRASVLLAASEEDPLLLEQQHGVGRSAVWATDAGALFARPWLAWPGYRAMFGQLSRSLARSPERRDAQVAVTLDGGAGTIVVEAIDDRGRTRNHLDLAAAIAGPGGRSERIRLSQTGAGRYEASFSADTPGAYLVTVQEGGGTLVGSAGVVRARGDELRGEGTNRALLEQIAALTGGRVRRDLRAVFRQRPEETYVHAPFWEPLVIFAMLALLASVALRRLVLPWKRPASAARVETPIASTPLASTPIAAVTTAEPPAESAPPPTEAPDAPPSLAETLLARKKRKR